MKRIIIAALGAALCGTAVFADDKPTDAEAKKIQDAVKAWGCDGGKLEKETEGSGVFEVDDAKCKVGNYDFRLDKDFNVWVITRD